MEKNASNPIFTGSIYCTYVKYEYECEYCVEMIVFDSIQLFVTKLDEIEKNKDSFDVISFRLVWPQHVFKWFIVSAANIWSKV